jgi:hypothetical protein
MNEIIVKVPEEQVEFFNQLIKKLGYSDRVKKAATKKKMTEKERILLNIEEGLKELKLVKAGKLKAKTLKQFLDEV